jgi:O-antigen ligase
MNRLGHGLMAAVTALFGALLVWAPLPLGSNRPWSWSLLAVTAAVLLAVWAVAQLLAPQKLRLPWVVGLAAGTTLLVWAYAFLQTVPVAALPWLEPHPIWAELAAAGLEGTVPVPGLDAGAGREALMRLMSYGAVFWLAFALAQDRARARLLLQVILAATTACAAYGLLNHFTGWEMIGWVPKTAYVGDVTGTFVNRNSFATYANLGLLVCLVLLAEPFLAARSGDDLKRIAVQVLENLLGRRSILLLALIVLATASLQSHSRGGLLSGIVAVLVLLLLVFLVGRPRPLVGAVVLAVALGAGWGILQVSGQISLERLAQTDETGSNRTNIWDMALQAYRERPTLGQGYGSYPAAVAQRRDERFVPPNLMAHDTYLEHLVELGWPATLLLYLGPALLFLYTLRGVFARRRDQLFPLAAAAATVLVALHALVDFSLQIPAVAVTYATLLGLGVAQAIPSGRRAPIPGASLRD